MPRWIIGLLLLGLLILGSLAIRVDAQGEKAPEVREIMGKLNKPTGIYYSILRELREEEPAWDELRPQAKTLAQQAAALTRAQPPKGDKASWDALVKAYADNARMAEQAVQKMDKAAARTALGRMGEPACKNCHKIHRKE